MERIMAEQYTDRARVYKGNRAAKNIRLKKRNTGKKIVIAALLIFIAAIITILIVLQNDKTAEKLIGIWRYDEYTQYFFEKDGTGKLLVDDVAYEYTYTIKGEKLIIDFIENIVRDCEYTYAINDNGTLTLIGGLGTDGGCYDLNKE